MRDMSSALRAHLAGPARTTCWMLRLTLADARVFGLTMLDRDVEYQGVTYSAANGFDPSMIATDTGLSVDNSQPRALIEGDIPGITAQMVAAGELDDAQWEMILVNYRDLSMGHAIIGAGDVGEVNLVNGKVYMPELLDYVMRLRQSFGYFWSRTCRAVFGSPAESHTGCGVDAEVMWVAGEVTGLSDEPTRVFADNGLIDLDPEPIPGRVQWLTGPNAGQRLYQVEGYGSITGTIALVEPTPFPISAGDEFRIRPDCNKTPAQCTAYDNWLNYKGESLIPTGEGAALMTPQASIPGGFQGSEVIE